LNVDNIATILHVVSLSFAGMRVVTKQCRQAPPSVIARALGEQMATILLHARGNPDNQTYGDYIQTSPQLDCHGGEHNSDFSFTTSPRNDGR